MASAQKIFTEPTSYFWASLPTKQVAPGLVETEIKVLPTPEHPVDLAAPSPPPLLVSETWPQENPKEILASLEA